MQFNDEIFYQDDRGRWFSFELVHKEPFLMSQSEFWRAFDGRGFLAQAPTREEVIEKAKAAIYIENRF